MQAYMHRASYYCPECGFVMSQTENTFRAGVKPAWGTQRVQCVNVSCPQQNKLYRPPTFNLIEVVDGH